MIIDTTKLPEDVSSGLLRLLGVLHDAAAAVNVTDLATAANLHNVSASEYLWKLERRRIVTRVPNPNDRRQQLFLLTRKGRDYVAAFAPAQAHHIPPVPTVQHPVPAL